MPTFSVLQGSEGEWTSDKTVEILGKEFQHISSLILSCFVVSYSKSGELCLLTTFFFVSFIRKMTL